MRVAIIGGTGFVGRYVVDALVDAGHRVTVLVRPGSEGKLQPQDCVRRVAGDLADRAALRETLGGAGAVVYNVGLLREFPRRDITFEAAQFRGVADTVAAARERGVSRLLLMSAIGVKDPGTAYQSTKRRAELHALAGGLDVTVLRPSVVFGDPRGAMEFATQLQRDMVKPPVPAVAFPGVRLSPVFVEDVAAALVAALADDATIGETLELAGPEVLSWRQIVSRVAAASGRSKLVLPVPLALMRAGAALFDWLPFYPVTRDQLTMLAEGNTAPPDTLERLIGRPARPFAAENLRYLATDPP
ncbi:MAG: NAD(P)H-binding protein [Proteobacteria bacterium]|nr:NAD(P)H-binding protein [Pseudomonadota bacterium]